MFLVSNPRTINIPYIYKSASFQTIHSLISFLQKMTVSNFKSWSKLSKLWSMDLYSAVRAALAKSIDCFKLFTFIFHCFQGRRWGFNSMQRLEWKCVCVGGEQYIIFSSLPANPHLYSGPLKHPKCAQCVTVPSVGFILTAARTWKVTERQVTYCRLHNEWFICLHICRAIDLHVYSEEEK